MPSSIAFETNSNQECSAVLSSSSTAKGFSTVGLRSTSSTDKVPESIACLFSQMLHRNVAEPALPSLNAEFPTASECPQGRCGLRTTLKLGASVFGLSAILLLALPAPSLDVLTLDSQSDALAWSMRMISITLVALAGIFLGRKCQRNNPL